MYYTNPEREKDALQEAQSLRLAASQISKIKKVISDFDGKIYNCRFDEAINKLRNENIVIGSYVDSYGYFNIYVSDRHSANNITLLRCKKATKGEERPYFTDAKRIKADAMIEQLNYKYGELLKSASEIEETVKNIKNKINQLESLKKAMNAIISTIPAEVANIYRINHIY